MLMFEGEFLNKTRGKCVSAYKSATLFGGIFQSFQTLAFTKRSVYYTPKLTLAVFPTH
jgi:hypothetical protein